MIIVMAKVVPSLAETFVDLDGEMPGITKVMIAMSTFFGKYWLYIIGALIALAVALKIIFNTEKGRVFWHKVKLKIPVIGKIALLNGASQYANTMAALMSAGLSVHQSLDITAKVLDNYVLSLETSMMSGRIEEGKQLGECMRQSKYFPKTLIEMCAIGENTGELDETLVTVGSYFDNEAEHATEKAISQAGADHLDCDGNFAGFIVISIYLPMFTMYELI